MSRTLHLFGTDWGAMMVPIQVIRWYRMQCYDGTDSCAIVVPIRRYCQNNRATVSCNLLKTEDVVVEDYNGHKLMLFFMKDNIRRDDPPAHIAVREALVNHTDYSADATMVVRLFPNKMVFLI